MIRVVAHDKLPLDGDPRFTAKIPVVNLGARVLGMFIGGAVLGGLACAYAIRRMLPF